MKGGLSSLSIPEQRCATRSSKLLKLHVQKKRRCQSVYVNVHV